MTGIGMRADVDPDCRFSPLFGGPRIGPTVGSASYELVLNGREQLLRADMDVATWPERVHRAAEILAAARSGPVEDVPS